MTTIGASSAWCTGNWIKSPIIDLCPGRGREEVRSPVERESFESLSEEKNGITGRELNFLFKIKSL